MSPDPIFDPAELQKPLGADRLKRLEETLTPTELNSELEERWQNKAEQ
jgi:hypothetical protein